MVQQDTLLITALFPRPVEPDAGVDTCGTVLLDSWHARHDLSLPWIIIDDQGGSFLGNLSYGYLPRLRGCY
jgi:hypothetical protein